MKVLVVKDDEGILRPQAGIWHQDPNSNYDVARISADHYLERNKGCTIVEAELIENK